MYISEHTLKCFLTLADAGQFTSAAVRCHMTQSALSQLIVRLEERVGVSLFNRESRAVTLTNEGIRLAETARRIVNELELVITDLRDVSSLHTGYVALAAVPSLAVMWLPKVLHKFHHAYPGIRLQLHDESSARCHELVHQGIVDFALNSQPMSAYQLQIDPLFDESLYVVCPIDHPLSRHRLIKAEHLENVEFLHLKGTEKLMVRTNKELQAARNVLSAAGVIDTGFEVNNMVTLAGLVAAGLGVCLAPETSLPLFKLLPTKAVKISPDYMLRQIFFIHQKGRKMSHAAAQMRSFLFEEK